MRKKILISLLFAGLLSLTGCKKALFSEFISKTDNFLIGQKFTGSILLAYGDTIIFSKGYGLTDSETPDSAPITEDSRLEIGSISKQFCAACIMQLVEKNKMSVEDKLSKYFPDYIYGDEITVKNLLNMRSGISSKLYFSKEITDEVQAMMEENPDLNLSSEYWIPKMNEAPLTATPGTRFDYNNLNYLLLAFIVEQVSGQPYAQYLQEHIFTPCKLTSTNAKSGNVDAVPVNHTIQPQHSPSFYSLGCGDINTIVKDLFKWSRAFVKGKVVSKKSVQEMTFNQKKDSPEYGYGFMFKEPKTILHNGSTFGYNAFMCYDYASKVTVIILCNQTQVNKSAQTMAQVISTFFKFK